ncbi:histidine phosphatase family protein [Streptomyces sp. NPDC093272]|jgi:broad specificity phosphatase PhoE|uniref:histidine phosphatase family protein n=1 Tax=unclassified Streptomyces TaxID=2593676 RepID=UPI0033197071
MSIHLTLLCAPGGDATVDPLLGDAHLSEHGMNMAGYARAVLSPHQPAVRTPSIRCSETADAIGLVASSEPLLRDLDVGTWQGRAVRDIAATDPDGFSAWRTDPDATPHDGESVRQLCRRAADWLSGVAPDTGRAVAIAEAAVVRAVLVGAMAVPARGFWHLTVPPLSAFLLTRRDDGWDVRFGRRRLRSVPRPTAISWG